MTYPGGKNGPGVFQAIISQMPPHSVYIEPFLGSGAVLRAKLPARLNIGIDRGDPCFVLLSGYDSPLYAQALKGWRHVTYQTTTRGGGRVTEHLWCNFPEPVELHDYRYLGRNWRERYDLKRMKRRWLAKLDKMPVLKRQSLLLAIHETNQKNQNSSSSSSSPAVPAAAPIAARAAPAAPAFFLPSPRVERGSGKNFVTSRQSQVGL